MTAISRIARLRHPGVLRDFTWPTDLPIFGRYNLIYGWNGSGKTTISKTLRALEMRRPPASGEVTLSIDGVDVRGQEFDRATIPVRVFNRDFVVQSVFPLGGADVPPILVVGKESVDKQKEVEQLRKALATAQATTASEESKKRLAGKAVDRHCIDRAALIRDTLRSSGSNRYNNYDKSDFRSRAQQMIVADDKGSHLLSASERDKLLAQHQATPKPKIQDLLYEQPDLAMQAAAVSRVLKTTVASAAIQSLKDDPTLSPWVHQGLVLHQARHAETCLFCGQRLPADQMGVLEAHFSAQFDQFLRSVDELTVTLQAASLAAATLVLPSRSEFYDDLAGDYETAVAVLRQALQSTMTIMESLVAALARKRTRPFESLSHSVVIPLVDPGVLAGMKEVIRKHNVACDEFQARASIARDRLEADSVAGVVDEFQNLVAAAQAGESSVARAEAETGQLNAQIARLEREIVEHREPAEELNEDLRKYLGHDELHLAVKDTGYTITRNEVPAQSLSEGEITAIALLYFLKSLKDRRFDLPRGVVVLDDPVSSLDANGLYLAFGYIRDRTKDAGQLFLLTHNFTFFRQTRNWFHHLRGQNKKQARFYMLECTLDGKQRSSRIQRLDPLLERYESEYHYLFARIYRGASVSTPTGLEDNYILPNLARRLLESFLAFRQPHVSGELWQKLKGVEWDETRKLRILRFVNSHSHGNTIGEPEHDPSLLGEAQPVLKDLLELIKDQDPEHFSAMATLVQAPAAESVDV